MRRWRAKANTKSDAIAATPIHVIGIPANLISANQIPQNNASPTTQMRIVVTTPGTLAPNGAADA